MAHRPPYLPGYGAGMLAVVEARTAEQQGAFALPHLRPGLDLLDVGCGPGSITVGLARRVPPGRVAALDMEPTQVDATRERLARALPGTSTEVRTGLASALPFADASFDIVFSHALLEHVAHPEAVLTEMRRVLRPAGILAVRSSDWSGALTEPPDHAPLLEAIAAHAAARRATGADPDLGHRLPRLVEAAGFHEVRTTSTHDEELPAAAMAAYLSDRLEAAAPSSAGRRRAQRHATALRGWAERPDARLRMLWVAVTAISP